MKKYSRLCMLLLSGVAILTSCKDEVVFTPAYPLNVPVDSLLTAKVDASKIYQTIDGFGASDAWNMDYVGKYWSQSNKEGIAKLLFSSEIVDGCPEGIGLSHWRFNVGGGTAEQGESSGIDWEYSKTRAVECFLKADGTYDWTKASGQQFFLKKAKDYGCESFTFFSCTPPVYYTKNGKGWSDAGASSNLKDEHYGDFANFLATVTKHFVDEGYNVSYISPVNEPEYNWGPGSDQEGSGWQNIQVAQLAKELNTSLGNNGLSNTKILLSEAGSWNYLYESLNDGRGNVLDAYFNPSNADTYVGNLEHLANIIAGHSYYTDKTWEQLKSIRENVRTEVEKYNGLKVYQTEWSMMQYTGEANYEDCPDFASSTYMDLSLAMSKVIHHDLVTANISSWCYWTSGEAERWGQLNRFYLIRLIPGGGDYGDMAEDGTYSASKNLWVLGNYSLFIRPGYQRVDLNIPNSDNLFFGSAYLSPEKDKLVIVYTNCSKKSIKVTNEFEGLEKQVGEYEQFVTSASTDLKKTTSYEKGIVPARSVATFVYSLN